MNAELAAKLRKLLDLDGVPIAVSFTSAPPAGLGQMKGESRLCEMLDKVRLDGESFYTTTENHECDGGATSTGLKEQSERSKTGEFLVWDIGLFGSPAAARRFMASNPRISFGTVKVISFAPLEKATFEPDVVVLICSAKLGLKVVEASAYESGKKATGLAGAPICSGVVAAPFLTGELVYSLGDSGARRFMKLQDGEVFIGIPAELLPGIVRTLESMASFRAKASAVGAVHPPATVPH